MRKEEKHGDAAALIEEGYQRTAGQSEDLV